MHSANSTTATIKRISGLFIAVLLSLYSFAQENSPYSRYGIGDLAPNRNVLNRGMGGISAAYSDIASPSINLSNPASLGSLINTIYDLGGDIDIRNLKSNTSPQKFKSVNTIISYLQVGFPITPRRMAAKGNSWGVSFGLRPVTRVNYKIEENKRLPNVDSVKTLYEGNGGLSQANISTGIKIKNFSFGASSGYAFGTKEFSTKITPVNDTVLYYKSNSANQTRFGGLFVNLGAQYDIKMKRNAVLRLGAYANLEQHLHANRDLVNETFTYGSDGGIAGIDTITYTRGAKGTLNVPATYSAGFTYTNDHWLFGADIDFAKWETYSLYGEKDAAVQNNYTFRAGAQYFAATDKTPASKYWSFVKYRTGFYYGNDYIKINKERPDYGVTFGAGFPLTSLRRNAFAFYREGLVVLNTGFEIGARGNKQSQSIRETTTRFSIGLSMNARWFQKVKYN